MRPIFCCRLYALQLLLVIFCAPAVIFAESTLREMPNGGDVINIARFGRKLSGKDFVGIQWDNPRDVYEVRIKGINRQMSESLRLEWWGSVWPDNGSGGWMRLDDPWNGQWVRIDAKPELKDKVHIVCQDITRQALDKKFDVIISAMAMHHVEDTDNLIKSFASHLEPQGQVALADLDSEDGTFHPEDVEGVYHHGFDRDALKAILEQNGFTDVAFTTAHTVNKEGKDYPVFLVTATRQ